MSEMIKAADGQNGQLYHNQKGAPLTHRGAAAEAGYYAMENQYGQLISVPANYQLTAPPKHDPLVAELAAADPATWSARLPGITDAQLDELMSHAKTTAAMTAIKDELARRAGDAGDGLQIESLPEQELEDMEAEADAADAEATREGAESDEDYDDRAAGDAAHQADIDAAELAADDDTDAGAEAAGEPPPAPSGADTPDDAMKATYDLLDRATRVDKLHQNVRISREALKLETDVAVLNDAIAAEWGAKCRETILKQLGSRVVKLGGVPWVDDPAADEPRISRAAADVLVSGGLAEIDADTDTDRLDPTALGAEVVAALAAETTTEIVASINDPEPDTGGGALSRLADSLGFVSELSARPAFTYWNEDDPGMMDLAQPGVPVMIGRWDGDIDERYDEGVIETNSRGRLMASWLSDTGEHLRAPFSPTTGRELDRLFDGIHHRIAGFDGHRQPWEGFESLRPGAPEHTMHWQDGHSAGLDGERANPGARMGAAQADYFEGHATGTARRAELVRQEQVTRAHELVKQAQADDGFGKLADLYNAAAENAGHPDALQLMAKALVAAGWHYDEGLAAWWPGNPTGRVAEQLEERGRQRRPEQPEAVDPVVIDDAVIERLREHLSQAPLQLAPKSGIPTSDDPDIAAMQRALSAMAEALPRFAEHGISVKLEITT